MQRLASDERLSRRLANGEAAAFDELYRRYAHRLSAYASSLLGDRHAGEDVAQVALLNAYQSLRAGKEPDRVRPWLFRIAHNEAVDMLARRRELLNGVDLDERPAPEDGGAVRGALLDALAKLPDRQRRAYLLREVHGLRIAEIAAELSLAAPQVEQALFAARNRLAETLVFGGSLTCDAARRLLEGPLAAVERKALRHHFRTCDACRATGIRVAPGLVSLDWLRGRLVDLLVGGAAPAAAKVGAVVVASVATGAAVGPPSLAHEPHATGRRLVLAAAVPVPARRPAPVQVRHAPAARPVVLAGPAPRPTTRRGRRESELRHEDAVRTTDRHGDSGRHGGRTSAAVPAAAAERPDDGSRSGKDGGEDGSQTVATTTVATVATTTIATSATTTTEGHDGGFSGHGSSGDGSSGGDGPDGAALQTATTEDGGSHGGHSGRD